MTNINTNAAIFLLRGVFGVLYRACCTFLELTIIIQKGSSTTPNSMLLLRSEALVEIRGDFLLFLTPLISDLLSYLMKNEEEWPLIPLSLYPRKSKGS